MSDFSSDFFMLKLGKKEQTMDVIPPLKDFFSIYTTAAFIIPGTLLLIKMRLDERKEKKRDRLKANRAKEEFNNNSLADIKDGMSQIMLEQGKMMKKENARDEFVDNKRFDLQTKSFNKRFDTIEETAKENKNDLKKTIEENKNDLKDFITQALELIKKDK